MVPPLIGLPLQILEVVKGPEREKIVPDVMDGALFHFSFFVGTSDIAGIGDNGKGSKELQKRFIVAYEGPVPFDNGRNHIIGDQFFGCAPEKSKSVEETPMQGLLSLRVGKFQVE